MIMGIVADINWTDPEVAPTQNEIDSFVNGILDEQSSYPWIKSLDLIKVKTANVKDSNGAFTKVWITTNKETV